MTPTADLMRLVEKAGLIRETLERCLDYLPEVPPRNCSCHLSPPCGDCVDFSDLRDLQETVHEVTALLHVAERDYKALSALGEARVGGEVAICGACLGRGKRDVAHGQTTECERCAGRGTLATPAQPKAPFCGDFVRAGDHPKASEGKAGGEVTRTWVDTLRSTNWDVMTPNELAACVADAIEEAATLTAPGADDGQ